MNDRSRQKRRLQPTAFCLLPFSFCLLLTAFCLLLFFPGCRDPFSIDDRGLVTSLRFVPSAFDSFRANTEVKYTLSAPSTVTLSIVSRGNGRDQLVATLASCISETKGTHGHTWLGNTNAGEFAPAAVYVGVLQIEARRFEAVVQVFHF